MNRKQAENILDAYVLLSTTNAKAAFDSLREVILDVMTSYQSFPITVTNQCHIDPNKPLAWTSEAETGQMGVGA